MKFKHYFIAAAMLMCVPTFAQTPEEQTEKPEGYVFDTVKILPITSIKNQSNAGTCWCYSTLGFIEAELLRMGKPTYDFSEMYIVYKTYMDRAEATVRTHGDVSFSQGGSFYDVIYGMEKFGLVPDEAMPAGAMHNDSLSNFTEFSAVADPYVKAIAKGELEKLQSDANNNMLWKNGLSGILNAYIGVPPTEFKYNGKTYTPAEFYKSTGLKASDYVSLTSYTHHPFYEPFVLEIQDNWRWGKSYNLPLDELMAVMDNAIEKGYPIAWGADVSEDGFRRNARNGFAVLPDLEAKSTGTTGSDMTHWTGLTAKERQQESMNHPTPQRWVSQEERQLGYDNYTTTDDHGMVIYGTAKDQAGNEYYIVKNSWGIYGKYDGSFFASKAFVRYKTMNIVVHKDALPKDVKKHLGIK